MSIPAYMHGRAENSNDKISGTRRIIGYFAADSVATNGYPVSKIPGEKLTAINYAFSNVSGDGRCVLGNPQADVERFYTAEESVDHQADDPQGLHGSFNQLRKLKEKHPHLKVLISIGGWTWSDHFSDAARSTGSRKDFVQSCRELYFQEYPGLFDGVDIDWEFPVNGGIQEGRPEDRRNFTLLLDELRQQLDEQGDRDGKRYLLTIAAPAGPRVYANLELERIHPYLDWINLMTYDFHGVWDSVTNFNAPLYKSSGDPASDPITRDQLNADAAVRAYLQAGIPSQKIVLGAPFYGRGWGGVPDREHGLYQPASGPAPGGREPGAFAYTEIIEHYSPKYQRHWHPEAKVPWLYNPEAGVMLSYDDAESIKMKAEYAKEHHLGGMMFWEMSQDGGELIDVIYESLRK
jgi:chitinase